MADDEPTPKMIESYRLRTLSTDPNIPQHLMFKHTVFSRNEFPELYIEMRATNRTFEAYVRTALTFIGFALGMSDYLLEGTYADYRAQFFDVLFAFFGFVMFFYGWIRYHGVQMATLNNKIPIDTFAPWMIFVLGNAVSIIGIILILYK
ncbi:hypothetical protein AKO1_005889 [Acrasis kona]|uniref:DUF202 domain-containing protein n=1 Tax=Acrasis kona TaxID=1008807 RepID=A0AAW2YMC0_9EUKA